MSVVASPTPPPAEDTPFVQFWNEVLAPKFIRFQAHPGGWPLRHSEAVSRRRPCVMATGFSTSAVASVMPRSGWRNWWVRRDVLSASIVATHFSIMRALKCTPGGLPNVSFVRADAEVALPRRPVRLRIRAIRHDVLRQSGCRSAQHAQGAAAGRPGWFTSFGANGPTIPGCPWPRTSCFVFCRRLADANLRPWAILDVERNGRQGDDDRRRL